MHTVLKAFFLALALALCSAAGAQTAKVNLDIKPQPMRQALKAFGDQTGFQILYRSGDVLKEGVTAPAVAGELSAQEALERLLANTGLKYEFIDRRTVRISSALTDKTGSAAGFSESVRLATAQTGAVQTSQENNEDMQKTAEQPQERNDQAQNRGIPEIMVTGKRNPSLNADIQRTRDDVRPYVILDRKAIASSGATNVDDLLRRKLSMSYVEIPGNQQQGSTTLKGGSSKFALRGLSSGETLILIDGRRATRRLLSYEADESQTDLNGIPLSAIERIEVLPTSASGIYGGSATGGVINVILRRDYAGVETALSYLNSFEGGGASRRLDVFGGRSFADGRVSLQLMGSHTNTSRLRFGDRSFIEDYSNRWQEDQIARRPDAFYNAYNPPLGATANISSYADRFDPDTGAWLGLEPLTLKSGAALGSTITSLPVGYNRAAPDADAALLANAGRYNLAPADSNQAFAADSDIAGANKTSSFDVTMRSKLTPAIEAFAEVGVTRTDFASSGQLVSTRFVIPGSAAQNPFEQDIIINAPLPSPDADVRTRMDTYRVLLGINRRFASDWSSAVEYSYSASKAGQNGAAGGEYVNGTYDAVSSGGIDLLQDPAGYAAALNASIVPSPRIEPARSHLDDISLRIAGPVLILPAGPVRLSVLAENARQDFGPLSLRGYNNDLSVFTLRSSGGKSNVLSFYSELTVSLASETQPLFGIRSAELQIAARYDRYRQRAAVFTSTNINVGTSEPASGSFDSTVPTVGLRFAPVRDVIVRASYGKGFLPPYINQLQPLAPRDVVLSFLTDPKRNNEPLGMVTYYSGGNPDLKPETSESRSAGVIFTPAAVDGLRLSFDWTRIVKHDNIVSFGGLNQRWVDGEDIYPVITREPDPSGAGRIAIFDTRLKNVLRSLSESYDVSADYAFALGAVNVNAAATVTRLAHSVRQSSVTSPSIDIAGTQEYPEWAGNTSLVARVNRIAATLNAQYFGGYWLNEDRSVDASQDSARLSSQTLFDLSAEYGFDSVGGAGAWLSGSILRIGVRNLLDTQPRYLARQSDTRSDVWPGLMGRTYFLSLSSSFGR